MMPLGEDGIGLVAVDVVLAGVDDGEVGDNVRTGLESELDAGGDEEGSS